MINITVIAVGKLKEKFFTQAIEEYSKRLSRYCKLEIIELKDEPTPDNPTEREKELVLEKESQKILEKIPSSAYVTALCIEGKQMSSEELSQNISSLASMGESHLVFIIGGSMGLYHKVKERANHKLSFSKMTFPHQLMRVILLEQIYRAFTISSGGKYHK